MMQQEHLSTVCLLKSRSVTSVRMLTLIGRPYFCVTRYTICSSTAEWSLDDGVLMLKRNVVIVLMTPIAFFHFQNIDAM
eukprot:4618527-Amphidinium_carterae.1